MINPPAAGRPGFDESPKRQAIGRQSALISSCLISWVGSRGRRLGDVQRRRKFHGPTPSMRWGVILVTYPGGGIGYRREDDIGPEIGIGEVLEGVGGTTLGHALGTSDAELAVSLFTVRSGSGG